MIWAAADFAGDTPRNSRKRVPDHRFGPAVGPRTPGKGIVPSPLVKGDILSGDPWEPLA